MRESRMVRRLGKGVLAIGLLGLISCGGGGEDAGGDAANAGEGKPTVYTTFYPTAYFAERIGGDAVEVVCPVPEEADPAHWRPKPDVLTQYQRADLIVINGAGFEQWIDQVSLPVSRIVNTSAPFEDRWLRYEEAVTHTHGPEGEHSHEGLDGHTWLDPVNAQAQAEAIRDALVELAPQHEGDFQSNFSALAGDLDALHQRLQELTEQYDDQPLLASHPAYNYLIDRYGWNVRNLDLDPETMPDEETFERIRHTLEEHSAEYLIWEEAPAPEIAERFGEELELQSIEFSPAELLSEEARQEGEDYLSIMRRNIENLRPALEPSS